MIGAALALAAGRWEVLPCIPTGPKAKAPLLAHGHNDASSDPTTIREWWSRWPEALLGIRLPDHLLVVDVDPRNGGSLEAVNAVLGDLPETLTSWSGRGDGGRHLWFHRPSGTLTSRRLPEGVDLKIGGKGYVIAPPSLHPSTGRPYRWEHRPVAHLPITAKEALRVPPPRPRPAPSPQRSQNAADGLVAFVSEAAQGERNSRLFWAACRSFERGDEVTISRLFDAALELGLTDQEAARTINSARNSVGGGAA